MIDVSFLALVPFGLNASFNSNLDCCIRNTINWVQVLKEKSYKRQVQFVFCLFSAIWLSSVLSVFFTNTFHVEVEFPSKQTTCLMKVLKVVQRCSWGSRKGGYVNEGPVLKEHLTSWIGYWWTWITSKSISGWVFEVGTFTGLKKGMACQGLE